MSCYTSEYLDGHVNLPLIRKKIQESLDNGLDDDEASIANLVNYHLAKTTCVEVSFMQSCRLYSVRFNMVDGNKNEYQYRFFVNSHRSR